MNNDLAFHIGAMGFLPPIFRVVHVLRNVLFYGVSLQCAKKYCLQFIRSDATKLQNSMYIFGGERAPLR